MTQSTAPNNVKITLYAANYIKIEWEAISDNHSYNVYRSIDGEAFILIATITSASYYDYWVQEKTPFHYKISSFDDYSSESDKTESEIITTFKTNNFSSLVHSSQVFLYKNFENTKYINHRLDDGGDFNFNNRNLVNGETNLEAILVTKDYNFSSSHTNLSDISNFILTQPEYTTIHGKVPYGCAGYEDSVPLIWNDIIMIFEDNQELLRYSSKLSSFL